MKLLEDIKYHILQSSRVDKLLYLLILFFITSVLFPKLTETYLALPASLDMLLAKPWSLLTYSLVHFRLFHVLSNLIVLFFIGNIFIDFFSEKKFIIYFISGVLMGALVFVIYHVVVGKEQATSLIGASAGVMAILVGVATKVPHYAVQLRFIGSVELWVLSAIFVGLSALGIVGVNIGGALAHLGGAGIGFLLTHFLKEGVFIQKSANKKHDNHSFKKVYTNNNQVKRTTSAKEKKSIQRKVDSILDKISKSGYESLTQEEKDFLFNQKA